MHSLFVTWATRVSPLARDVTLPPQRWEWFALADASRRGFAPLIGSRVLVTVRFLLSQLCCPTRTIRKNAVRVARLIVKVVWNPYPSFWAPTHLLKKIPIVTQSRSFPSASTIPGEWSRPFVPEVAKRTHVPGTPTSALYTS